MRDGTPSRRPCTAADPVKVFMYNSSTARFTDFRHGMDLFEVKVPALFRALEAGALPPLAMTVTGDPRLAEVFYHPAALVDTFFRARKGNASGPRPGVANAVENKVLREMRRSMRTHRPHVIHALRCPTKAVPIPGGRRHNPNFGEHPFARPYFPRLWDKRTSFRRFCSEAFGHDPERSAFFPFCPAAPNPELPFAPNRSLDVVFIGANHTSIPRRLRALQGLSHTPRSRAVLLRNRMSGVYGNARAFDAEVMRDAIFTLCPMGDTPGTPRIYHAIARGSVPLVDDFFVGPWAQRSRTLSGRARRRRRPQLLDPLKVDWRAISAPIRFTYPNGTWRDKEKRTLWLPPREHWARLQRRVWEARHSFECEPSSAPFVHEVERAMCTFAGRDMPDGSRPDWAPVWAS